VLIHAISFNLELRYRRENTKINIVVDQMYENILFIETIGTQMRLILILRDVLGSLKQVQPTKV
jgi:hypothetical protein